MAYTPQSEKDKDPELEKDPIETEGDPAPEQMEEQSASKVQPQDSIASINQVINDLTKWKDEEGRTNRESDNAVLAIGKLNGAIVRLTRE